MAVRPRVLLGLSPVRELAKFQLRVQLPFSRLVGRPERAPAALPFDRESAAEQLSAPHVAVARLSSVVAKGLSPLLVSQAWSYHRCGAPNSHPRWAPDFEGSCDTQPPESQRSEKLLRRI